MATLGLVAGGIGMTLGLLGLTATVRKGEEAFAAMEGQCYATTCYDWSSAQLQGLSVVGQGACGWARVIWRVEEDCWHRWEVQCIGDCTREDMVTK
jgi:hypothetical protein